MDGTLVDTEPYWIECEHELVAPARQRCVDRRARALAGRVRPARLGPLHQPARPGRSAGRRHRQPAARRRHRARASIHAVASRSARAAGRPARAWAFRAHWSPCRGGASPRQWSTPCRRARSTPSWSATTSPTASPIPSRTSPRRAAWACRPTRCLAIEDSPTGVRSAVAAGCITIGVPHVVAIPDDLGHRRLDSLDGLLPPMTQLAAIRQALRVKYLRPQRCCRRSARRHHHQPARHPDQHDTVQRADERFATEHRLARLEALVQLRRALVPRAQRATGCCS